MPHPLDKQQKANNNNNTKLPPIKQGVEYIKPKSMNPNRPPSSRSNAISEIDINSDNQSNKFGKADRQGFRKMSNNLMGNS